jgi:hypothetical protein
MRASFGVIAAAALFVVTASNCTVNKADNPSPTGPSEFALSLSLAAQPDTIIRDGESQSEVVIQALDPDGDPVSRLTLHLEIVVNTLVRNEHGELSAYTVVTGSNGRASVTYTAPRPFVEGEEDDLELSTVSIRATPVGTDAAAQLARVVTIRLVPSTPDLATTAASRSHSVSDPGSQTEVETQ